MRSIDLNVIADSDSELQSLSSMGVELGYSGLAISGLNLKSNMASKDIEIFSRFDLKTNRLSVLKKEAARMRDKYLVLAIPLGAIEPANWAAEEQVVDLLTLLPSDSNKLRTTTARLAAKSGTVLEVPIHSLLLTQGLHRSRALKTMTDAIKIALQCEMHVILTSGASNPIHLRSPYAMVHIGMLLGLNRAQAIESISDHPLAVIERNMKRLDDNHILPGLEIVGDDH
ncbi:MAG: RNase P subunit p30 family protein [Candidatus Thorarchaeota archaeon]